MFSKLAISALAAATVASAQSSSCTQSTFTIGSAAEATALSDCTTLKGDVLIPATSDPQIDLSGPRQIDGDLTLENNGQIISLSSTSLNSVSGTFRLANVTLLSTLNLPALTSVGTITWQSLPALNSLSFTTGVSSAKTVTISDTFLQSLDGIDLDSVGSMDINNNRRLTKFDTSLKNLSENLNIQANGAKLSVTMPNLVWIANMTIANVTEFSSPSLEVVNGSARFDSNYFESFAAPNMTSTSGGDISFINNAQLTNITFSALESIGGALTIVNNTRLEEITGFPKLAEVGGAIKLGGNFSNVEFPSLEDVKGTFELSSTNDIEDACTELKKNAPGSQGGNGVIQGKFTCTSNNEKANTGSTDGDSSSGSSGNSSSAAVNVHVNSAVVGLSFVGLLAQLL
ncbi:putative gpi-anchored cell wall organization protein ecm33 [Diaporthe ampelina]|uniref:Putative gpi-anchored cell wall organization protein ecm33 n=1 Tax=Diaporthe ampelina TaxID=1214573 RepID=A0A0G2F855_9PEZI|nr:putative gpi-anchored cell wall organization protein ecm33 [Diaporthe ampelina]